MKRYLHLVKSFCIAILLSFFSNVFGQTGTVTITRSSFPSGALAYNVDDMWTATASTSEVITGYFDLFANATQTNMQTRTNTPIGSYPYNVVAIPGNITKITLSGLTSARTWEPYLSTTPLQKSNFVANGTSQGVKTVAAGGTQSWDIDGTLEYKYFYINLTGSGAAYLNSIIIEYSTTPTVVAPTVTTTTASAITTSGATSGGNVTADGGATLTAKGVAFGTSANPTTGTSEMGMTTGVFTSTLSGLLANTHYYYRAYATNSAGTGYGTEYNFYTLANVPTAPTVSSPTSTTLDVTIGGGDLNSAATTYAIHETSTGLYVQANGTLGATPVYQTAAVWATVLVNGLTPSTTYTFEVKARNGANVETAFGPNASGTTTANQTANWCNVQWPTSQTIVESQSFTVYARVYAAGLTEGPTEATNISAWIGYSTSNDINSGTWTWVPATFNASASAGNNDEYSATIGANLDPGQYYYVSRFQIGSGTYVYGGINDNFWTNTSHSASLLVNADIIDWANYQSPATGSYVLGATYDVFGRVRSSLSAGAGQDENITAEVGYSLVNTNPNGSGWTWVAAQYNTFGPTGDSDEYMHNIGADITTAGTYYLAFRYKTPTGSYIYGGTNGVWNNDNATVTVQAPQEINIKQGATNYLSASTYTFAGTQTTGTSSAPITFTVENLGDVNLTLGALSIAGANASEFTITQPLTSTVNGHSTTTFTVTFSPITGGTKVAQLSLPNSDADENPYLINLSGRAGPANDNCDNAIELTMNAPAVAGTLMHASYSTPFSNGNDVWYKVTTSCAGKLRVDVSGFTGNVNVLIYNSCTTATTASSGVTGYTGISTANPEIFISSATLAAGTYYIRVSAADVTAQTSDFNIAVSNGLLIETHPVNQSVNRGVTAQFSSSISPMATTYQWQVSTDSGSTWSNVTDGSTNTTGNQYTTVATDLHMNGWQYRVIVSNGDCYTSTSNAATLTVNNVSIASDYYRSTVASGRWNVAASWESSSDGVNWMSSTRFPNLDAKTITIRSGHTINVTAQVTVDEVIVEENATLDLQSSTLTINNGDGDDLVVYGLLKQSGTSSMLYQNPGATYIFHDGASYDSYRTAVYIPYATWHPNSTVRILGSPTSIDSQATFNQTFGNLIINYNGSSFLNFSDTVTSFKVLGTMDIVKTGTSQAICFSDNINANKVYDINNLIVRNNSNLQITRRNGGTASSNKTVTVNISGDLLLENNAVVDFGTGTSDGPNDTFYGLPTRSYINLGGNLNASSGSKLYVGGNNASYGIINFANDTERSVSISNPNTYGIMFHILKDSKVKLASNIFLDEYVSIDVEGQLDLANHVISSSANSDNELYTYPDSVFKTAHSEGIASFDSFPTTGAVRVTYGDYDIEGVYVYNGMTNQVTGNGLPETVKSIIIDNTGTGANNEVTLTNDSLEITSSLDIQKGIFNLNNKTVAGATSATLNIEALSTLKVSGDKTFPTGFDNPVFKPTSIVEYGGTTQEIVNTSTAGYVGFPNYQTLKISGNGVKTAKGNTTVDELTKITDANATLRVPEYDAVNSAYSNFYALGGIDNANGTTGAFVLGNDANLMQHNATRNNAVNNAQISVEKTITPRKISGHAYAAKEYNYLISPTNGRNIKNIFGNVAANTQYVLALNERTGGFVNTGVGAYVKGKGFAVKEPVATFVGTADHVTAEFYGVPANDNAAAGEFVYNMDYSVNAGVESGFNLIGNPYPSNIDLNEVYRDSKIANGEPGDSESSTPALRSTFKFWDNTANSVYTQQGTNYSGYAYAFYNAAAGNGTALAAPGNPSGGNDDDPSGPGTKVPSNIVKVGQAFMAQALTAGAKVVFKNSQRTSSQTNSVFFGKNAEENDRYWIHYTTPSNLVFSNAIVYFEGGTYGFTQDDSLSPEGNSDGIFTYADNHAVVINGRPSFNTADVLKVGTRHFVAGQYSIRIGKKEGVFANGQKIYLKDKHLGTLADITNSSYAFTTAAGEFTNRFEIVYKETTLAVDNNVKDGVKIYRDTSDFVIAASNNIKNVEVYDASGRLLHKLKSNAKEVRLDGEILANGIYILKVNLQSGETVSSKIRK